LHILDFIEKLQSQNISLFTGVPDSQLQSLCNYLMNTYGISNQHIIAANEGNAVAIAAGYHLATGKIPCVYMQNSGLGNIINPAASLLHPKVYGIPCVFIIGWRGEPGVIDEPQHVFQGEITLELLEVMDIAAMVIDKETTVSELETRMHEFAELLAQGKSVAFVIKKGGLVYDETVKYGNEHGMLREEIIRHIVGVSGEDIIISTTGKASRELFEIREQNGQPHCFDFLTVGSMGHSSSIALGIALHKPQCKVWCVDGDGSVLMHMGAMAVLGANAPANLVHLVINNESHETVGGMPTVAGKIDLVQIAKGCGYQEVYSVNTFAELDEVLRKAKQADKLVFVEVKSAIGARKDLGRPTTTARENKEQFMKYLRESN